MPAPRIFRQPELPNFLRKLPALKMMGHRKSYGLLVLHYGASVLMFVLALVIRFVLEDVLPPGFPYLTFFPAVIISAFVFGVKPGAVVAVLSGLAAWYFFIEPANSFALDGATLLALLFFVFIVVTDLVIIHLMMSAYRREALAQEEARRSAEMQKLMVGELDHRIKNVFATVNAVISLSQKHAASPEDLATNLRTRISALSQSSLILRGIGNEAAATLDHVIEAALAGFVENTGRQVQLEGPEIELNSMAVTALSLIVHELATNAAKYGALSSAEGVVEVRWFLEDAEPEGEQTLRIVWRERGGPPPAVAAGKGFGSELLTKLTRGLGGGTATTLGPEGAAIDIACDMGVVAPQRTAG